MAERIEPLGDFHRVEESYAAQLPSGYSLQRVNGSSELQIFGPKGQFLGLILLWAEEDNAFDSESVQGVPGLERICQQLTAALEAVDGNPEMLGCFTHPPD